MSTYQFHKSYAGYRGSVYLCRTTRNLCRKLLVSSINLYYSYFLLFKYSIHYSRVARSFLLQLKQMLNFISCNSDPQFMFFVYEFLSFIICTFDSIYSWYTRYTRMHFCHISNHLNHVQTSTEFCSLLMLFYQTSTAHIHVTAAWSWCMWYVF